jgi:S1-C subfamily serine protease
VDAFSRQIDGLEMERLYLRDQATREGWLDSSRYRQESRRISEAQRASRDEFGEQMYDWFLYSTKHPNRVRVEQVFEGSPADEAGLRVGDLIVRYDDRKIFGGQDLRESTVSGRAGDLTPVDLERGGEEIRVYVPRGPLGIRMHPTTRKPAPPR